MRKRIILLLVATIFAALACGCERQGTVAVSASPEVTADRADAAFEALARKAEAEIDKAPDDPAGYTRLASLYIRKARESGDFGLNAKADAAVDRALAVSPKDVNARKLKASLHLTFHRFKDALGAALSLQKDLPIDAFVFGVLTDANAEIGNYDEAIDAAQKMVDFKPNTASYARVGHLRSLHGDFAGAVEMFKLAARTADPSDREAQSWCLVQLGNEYWKNGKYVDAEKTYDEALQILPHYYLAMTGRGRVRAAQGDLDGAVSILSDAQNRIPNVETVILLADVYTKLDRQDEAARQSELVEVIEQKLGLVGDQKRLALFWTDRDERLGDALEIAEREYAARKDIYTADTYAWCLLKNGRVNEAADVSKQALKLKTGDALIYYHAGMIEQALGNKKDAKRLLELALKTNSHFDLLQSDVAKRTLEAL